MYPLLSVLKSNWMNGILLQYLENCWRTVTQIDPQSFKHILDLIKNSQIFCNKSTSSQAFINQQLKLGLHKLANNISASRFCYLSNQ